MITVTISNSATNDNNKLSNTGRLLSSNTGRLITATQAKLSVTAFQLA